MYFVCHIGGTVGSPPQVRGKHLGGSSYCKSPGITPAGAGKTCCPLVLLRPRADHPRRCGENKSVMQRFQSSKGSPPRMRGKLIGYIIPLSVKKSNIWHSASFFLFTANIDFAYCVLTCSFYISDGIIPALRHIQFDMIKRCCTFLCSAAIIY